MARILWLRRDLRLHDNPALVEATRGAYDDGDGQVVPLVVIDPILWDEFGPVRQNYLVESLKSLDKSFGGNLLIQHGDPRDVVPRVAAAISASAVHVSTQYTPYAIKRDARVLELLALQGCEMVHTGSGYAVAPGRITKDDGTAYKVYTPFYKNWMKHGWRSPAEDPEKWPTWVMPIDCDGLPTPLPLEGMHMPEAGEQAALERWTWFKENALNEYADNRNTPGIDGTSKLSVALKWGEIHPRTLLADLGESQGHEVYRKEIAWREFYADVLFNRLDTIKDYFNPLYKEMKYDTGPEAEAKFDAWAAGETGYPIVDAAMRQLRAEGWMHNRTRMVVASFLVKDLHIEWKRGADFFESWLLDFDAASNSHGWQWTAGCGTDASPYYRVFNPTAQGQRFDPSGDYIRKYIPELRHLLGSEIHEPWTVLGGLDHGYPSPIVDHAAERIESLDRLALLPKGAQKPLPPQHD